LKEYILILFWRVFWSSQDFERKVISMTTKIRMFGKNILSSSKLLKVMSIILATCMLISLTACGGASQQDAQQPTAQYATVDPVSDVPEDPAGEPDDGYWHEEEPAVSAADLQAAAEAELSRLAARVNETGGAWTITNTHVIRSSDTQYGIYVMVECEFGGIERAIKAEVSSSGEIIVGYWSNGANTANDGSYESFDVGPSSIDTFDFSL
jgi:hypothetical protein